MKQYKLSDFDNLPWRSYHPDNKCVFCNETANNGGHNMCNSHTDIYRKLRRDAEEKRINTRMDELKLDLSQIDNIEFDGVYNWDAPDYCDAYISAATQNDTPLTDEQLDFINDSFRDWIYDKLQDYLY